MDFKNTYQDAAYAAAYSKLEFPGTYYLAFRDLRDILSRHVATGKALDFGCGTGRSTRFLSQLGFDAVGIDVAEEMIAKARDIDPTGDYRRIVDGDFSELNDKTFDLVFSAFTFDNVPTREGKVSLFHELARVLKKNGRVVNLVSSPEIYWHEWASFSTREFPENRRAKCGDPVWIVNTAVEDRRPVLDLLWLDENYFDVYREAGLEVIETHRPLGRADEPYEWVNETTIAPWVIYVLRMK